MIVTVTLNPGLDLTYTLRESALGAVDVHRATASTVEASGKGVNVSRTLHWAGVATVAVLPVGGATGQHLDDLLSREGVAHLVVPVEGDTRINTSLLLASGHTVKVNGPGHLLGREDVDRLLGLLDDVLAREPSGGERWLAVCGSLPPGTGAELVAELVEVAHRHGTRCAVDASGPALAAALTAGADLLAPNSLELADLAGVQPASVDWADAAGGDAPGAADGQALGAAGRHAPGAAGGGASGAAEEELRSGGVPAVIRLATELAHRAGTALLVSMGPDGAVFADGSEVVHGTGPVLVPVNTAGAGDAFLAGWLAAAGSPAERMARALAFGRSACLSPNTVDREPGTKGLDGITVRHVNQQEREGGTS